MSVRQNGNQVSFSVSRDGTSSQTWVFEASSGETIVIPGGDFLLKADFVRHGSDLILKGDDGTTVVIRDYFAQADPPTLMTEGGAMLPPDLVAKLAGSVTPGQHAQADAGSGQ